jgi:adenosine deaminase CECR1
MVTRSLLGYETAYREQIRRMLWAFAEDGVQYVEMRVALGYKFTISNDSGEKDLDIREILQIFVDVMDKELPRMHDQGFDFFGMKVIYACMRNSTKESMIWCMDKCIEMKQQFPDLICGETGNYAPSYYQL